MSNLDGISAVESVATEIIDYNTLWKCPVDGEVSVRIFGGGGATKGSEYNGGGGGGYGVGTSPGTTGQYGQGRMYCCWFW